LTVSTLVDLPGCREWHGTVKPEMSQKCSGRIPILSGDSLQMRWLTWQVCHWVCHSWQTCCRPQLCTPGCDLRYRQQSLLGSIWRPWKSSLGRRPRRVTCVHIPPANRLGRLWTFGGALLFLHL